MSKKNKNKLPNYDAQICVFNLFVWIHKIAHAKLVQIL